ncbi:2OG-Fe dioxygenase family protein [Acetobacter thailandicus]|uniref:2OG-Fe dioxygenase family protein n=1 Tax=Acetobacter thailandicus TaxID=1502842 RepID=UPI001BAC9167|nr:2OG-Fe dioxygenase family protein [Acetobacter thailandicus]MBS0986159.1 2OG-Fe dioxygenase family protein [Acetobacter thailandicus]
MSAPSEFSEKTCLDSLEGALQKDGFAYEQAVTMRPLLEEYGLKNWESFATSWNNLGVDRYMADNGRYRRRRYATYSVSENAIIRKAHQPHYQSRDYNTLNGGIERLFKPITQAAGSHPALLAVLAVLRRIATNLTPENLHPKTWHAEVHQFRIEANASFAGQPTPEGLHQDGVDWVCVLMVHRENITSGTTTIYDLNRNPAGSFTLTNAMDAAFVNDSRVYHGVTAITPLDTTRPAYRDVLVVTLRHE